MWATSNCVKCSRRNPKRSAKHAYLNGWKASSIARAGISCRKKQRSIEKIVKYTMDLLSLPEHVIKKGRPSMATDVGKSQETKNIIWLTNWRRKRKKKKDDRKQSRWICLSCMGRSCRTRSHLSNGRIRILSLQAKLVDLSQSVRKQYPIGVKTFWLQPSVVYIKTFTPRSWRTTTQADALLEIQRMETGIEFFLYLLARILVVCLRIQRKSIKEDASKGLRSNGATRCLQNFGENPQTNGFQEFILFCHS